MEANEGTRKDDIEKGRLKKELLLGCGSSRVKKVSPDGTKEWSNLITVDFIPKHGPDIIWNLNITPWPFMANEFDEIHAYEVLEHLGTQGNFSSFFEHFYEIWHALKPGGFLCGTCPKWNSPWAWSDPGHTRIISPESFVFLNQEEYRKQVGKTPMSDYRPWWKGDFEIHGLGQDEHSTLFVLKAIKPARL